IAATMARERVRRPFYFDEPATPVDCPVHLRDDLAGGAAIDGPALIQEYASTTVMFDGDRCVVADTGELIIRVRDDT
ncbi:MAG: hydantoinase/oxoprolinase family protein, partial [Pseudomonadota bacterium]|nr:hydantoinase/oxoprolinase family protein [Pseudomonadota bacterium]